MKKNLQLDDWVFEVKMVRALKTPTLGEPYTAVALLTISNDQIYIDTTLNSEHKDSLSRKDFRTIYNFCRKLGMKTMTFDRVKNGVHTPKVVQINRDR